MATTDIDKVLAQADEQYKAELARLKEEHDRNRQWLVETAKARGEFSKALSSALDSFRAIPVQSRFSIWHDSDISKTLKELGLQVRQVSIGKGKGSKLSEQILEYIAIERSTDDVVNHFGNSKLTIRNHLNALKDAGKATGDTKKGKGRMMFWQKT